MTNLIGLAGKASAAMAGPAAHRARAYSSTAAKGGAMVGMFEGLARREQGRHGGIDVGEGGGAVVAGAAGESLRQGRADGRPVRGVGAVREGGERGFVVQLLVGRRFDGAQRHVLA